MIRVIEHRLAISEEKHTGMLLFIPYCDAQGCSWIGTAHISKAAAQHEGGARHINPIKNRRARERAAIPYAVDDDHRMAS